MEYSEVTRVGCRCTLCEYKSKQAHNTRRHIKFMHLHYSENVPCTLCGKTFTRMHNFKEHMKSVHGHGPMDLY